jgi:GMP synthase (glutamine-hydrolysing)
MARHYGGDCSEAESPEFGAMEITLNDGGGTLFQETPETQVVWESHNDEVTIVPDGFFITASSPSCQVQAMENDDGNRFGLQFHPEVNDSEYGAKIMENFVEICRQSRN